MTTIQLNDLINAVETADSAQALVDAVRDLADAKQLEAIPLLIEVLNYNNPGAAVAAVDGLVALGQSAVEPLLGQLEGQNYTARSWAVRALAGIGDPRGLPTLLDTLENDFAMSVRRAAARGLGKIRWQEMPNDQVADAQQHALDALLDASEDSEWIVRYAAVTGLEAMAIALSSDAQALRDRIVAQCDRLIQHDENLAVRGRTQLATQRIQAMQPPNPEPAIWCSALERLYHRKAEERPFPEGDPRKFRTVAASLSSGKPAS